MRWDLQRDKDTLIKIETMQWICVALWSLGSMWAKVQDI